MLTNKQKRKLIRAYYDLNFSGSYSGYKRFHEEVQKHMKMNVSLPQIRRLLKDDVLFQIHTASRKNILQNHIYKNGVGLEV